MMKLLFSVLFAVSFWISGPYALGISDSPTKIHGNETDHFPGTKSYWKGFVRYDFEFEGRACRIICPSVKAEGNPWIWNARFPDWHTETDSILLSEGFYVTNINTDEFNGSHEGVSIWDRYFKFVTDSLKLENKVALEGISRGGLYVYNFAKKYPYRVSCIYCEAPVCDFKSWPGGFGKGPGSQQDWQLILKAYGFKNDQEAKSFKDNPVDNLEMLAAEKVPVLHMIGLNDTVVPPDENSFILIDRYIRLGGPATVIPCTRGRQELKGHHFDIETPDLVARFIRENTRAFRSKLKSEKYHLYRQGLSNSALRFEKEKSGRVAFLGGSITYNSGWRDSVCQTIQKRFPETAFEFINAGIPSLGSLPDAFRINNDVLSKGRIDLLFVEAAVNDRTNGYSSQSQIRSMEGIVRQSKTSNPQIDIVFMYFADPDKINDYNTGIIPEEIQNHEKVAFHYNIPSINLAREVAARINNREFTWRGDFIDLHPSRFGQQIYNNSISDLLVKCWKPENIKMNYSQDQLIPPKLDPLCYDKGKLISAGKEYCTEGWILDSNWSPEDGASTREDFVHVPMLICTEPGKILKTAFKGTAIGIAVASGPDAGIIEYSIDGKEWKKADLFTQWSAFLHLPWFVTLSDGLKNGNHTLRLRLDNDMNKSGKGTSCRIRYFFVN
ncbi:MAG: SGNH/GDSL hydrolase family protein [Bacteroidales bacterium]|nr:SGNH/GDSL hydrolase family protein [Bacteroidales bacterium]